MSYPRVKVLSKHPAFAPIDTVREVSDEEARVLCMIGRAELLREGTPDSKIPAREVAPVTRDMTQQRSGKSAAARSRR